MMKIFFMLIYLINILFLNFNNPLIMGILMMTQTMLMILLVGKIHYSFWFSYIIFLVFIGGLFILFVYMISLTYNNKFFKMNYNYFYITSLILLLILFYKNNLFYLNEESLNELMIMKKKITNSLKFFNFPNNYINILLITMLLILMIMVVKITNFFKGPLKMKLYKKK